MSEGPDDEERLAPGTIAAQALGREDAETRALVPPIHPSTTYLRDADGGYRSGRGYTRADNPTYDAPEDLLARLEGGASALLFASGMAAASSVFLSLLPGDHVLAPRVMYWALRKWLADFALPWGLDVELVDTTDADVVRAALQPGRTKLVWLETPGNPLWDVSDIAACAELAHAAGARLAVDSTVATPVHTRPIELGADLVVHSATKYLNGHSDVLAGAVVTARRDGFWQRIRSQQRDGGAVLGPFEAWLLLRGMRTLFARVPRASATALALAEQLRDHPAVSAVLYPGLPEHPGHAVAARQMRGGFGGMLSIRVAGGERAAVETAAAVRVFKRATSLGGVESLIEHRASIEGPSTPVPADLLRLSIGLEEPEDLAADLDRALRAGMRATASDGAPEPPASSVPEPSETPIAALVRDRIRPMVLDRGGDVRVASVQDGAVVLELEGSPGAAHGIERWIEGILRSADPSLTVRFAGEAEPAGDGALEPRIERMLEAQMAPALAAHGGGVRLRGLEDGLVHLELTGRCRGCTMAEVTLRQGIEVALRDRFPALRGVVDHTDHAAGTNPYFAPGKSGGPGEP